MSLIDLRCFSGGRPPSAFGISPAGAGGDSPSALTRFWRAPPLPSAPPPAEGRERGIGSSLRSMALEATTIGRPRRRRGRLGRLYYGWWVLFGMVVAMVVAEGVTFGSFGAYVLPLEDHFGWSRAQVSLGFSVTVGVVGATAPLIGRLDRRRRTAPADADRRAAVLRCVRAAGVHDRALAVVLLHGHQRDLAGLHRLHPRAGARGALVRRPPRRRDQPDRGVGLDGAVDHAAAGPVADLQAGLGRRLHLLGHHDRGRLRGGVLARSRSTAAGRRAGSRASGRGRSGRGAEHAARGVVGRSDRARSGADEAVLAPRVRPDGDLLRRLRLAVAGAPVLPVGRDTRTRPPR